MGGGTGGSAGGVGGRGGTTGAGGVTAGTGGSGRGGTTGAGGVGTGAGGTDRHRHRHRRNGHRHRGRGHRHRATGAAGTGDTGAGGTTGTGTGDAGTTGTGTGAGGTSGTTGRGRIRPPASGGGGCACDVGDTRRAVRRARCSSGSSRCSAFAGARLAAAGDRGEGVHARRCERARGCGRRAGAGARGRCLRRATPPPPATDLPDGSGGLRRAVPRRLRGPMNCGGCGIPCAAGRLCGGGVCQCPSGMARLQRRLHDGGGRGRLRRRRHGGARRCSSRPRRARTGRPTAAHRGDQRKRRRDRRRHVDRRRPGTASAARSTRWAGTILSMLSAADRDTAHPAAVRRRRRALRLRPHPDRRQRLRDGSLHARRDGERHRRMASFSIARDMM